MLKVLADDCHDPGCGFAIPKWRTPGRPRGLVKDRLSGGENAIRVHSYDLIRAVFNGGGPFRVRTQGEARHAQERGFLLDSAGVCEDNAGMAVEGEEIEITERLKRHNSGAVSSS